NAVAAVTLTETVENGLNMKGAWNLAQAMNDPALNDKVWADLTTLWSSNVAATIGTSTDVDFYLNGVNITFTTDGSTVAQIISDTLAAINAVTDQTGVLAEAGDSLNGGTTDAIVLKKDHQGDRGSIVINKLMETGSASTGLANVFQNADATHNTGRITLGSEGKFEITTSAGDDSILDRIGLDGGSAFTGQPGDTAGDGTIFVSSGPNRVRFVPNTDYVGTADITFRTWDNTDSYDGETGVDVSTNGDNTAYSTATATAEITVNPTSTDIIVPDGNEFLVNTITTDTQALSSVTTLSDGKFVVVWEDATGPSRGQLYDATGSANGSEFQIAATGDMPTVTALNDGGFVVVWMAPDGGGNGLFGLKYDSSGTVVGSTFSINSTTASDQQYQEIAALDDGGFVVIWDSVAQDGDINGIFAQRFDSSCSKITGEFQVNTYTTSSQTFPAITGLNDGGFLAVWTSINQDGDSYGIYAQRYDLYGNPVGSEFP
ncbi:MAG: hypothetical protein KAI75_09115, partial [Desulfobulbaceae bacterium]|nr:hypothetical protein [Desulfobulbaceae bacterium]